MSKKIQVIILAGGEGTRLRPFTTVLPKPLMPVGDLPIAEIIIRQLSHYGLKNIAISTGYLAQLIQAYFGDGKKWGVNISYISEDKPLGTAGAIKLVNNLEEDFLVINGDVLSDINFKELVKFHKRKKAMATIAVKERKVKSDFGEITVSDKDELVQYAEKPEHRSWVSMGIYMLNKKSKTFIEKDEFIGMPDLLLRMRDKDKVVNCFKMKDMWLDLGRLADFEAAQEVFEKNKKKFLHT